MPSNGTRGNAQKFIRGKFHLNMKMNFFTVSVTKHLNRLPREAEESPSPGIFKTSLDTILFSVSRMVLLEPGGWTS